MTEIIAKLYTDEASAALSELVALSKRQAERLQMSALLGNRGVVRDLLQSPDAKTRKNAARLLGALGYESDAEPLIAALKDEKTLFIIPSLLLALGSIGGELAGKTVEKYVVPTPKDETEQKHCDEIAEAKRKAENALNKHTPMEPFTLNQPRQVLLVAPEGFSGILCRELEELSYTPEQTEAGALVVTDNLQKLFRARCFLEVLIPLAKGIPITPEAVAEAARPMLTLPWRLELKNYPWERSAFIRAVSRELGGGDNPSSYALELRVVCRENQCDLFLRPANVPDGRFSYRKRAIPASIAPATAACLARLAVSTWRAGLSAADKARQPRVLDPFFGSGTLLIEIGKITKCAALTGVDISPLALAAARENAAAAHATIRFVQTDAKKFIAHEPYDMIVSNLPFGNRVGNHDTNETLYRCFVKRLPELLAQDGTVVLYTMERRLLNTCLKSVPELEQVNAVRTEAGGLLPWAVVLKRKK